jgi:hypothetical protein
VACHSAVAASYHDTAHAHASSAPTSQSIGGSFASGDNVLRTANPDLSFTLDRTDQGFFETAHRKQSADREMSRSERIDVVIGSGRKGQTYLFWNGDTLLELPVSYWTSIHGWVNSPGYADGTADFERPIIPRCLECHATSFTSAAPPENRYERRSLVLGISCEKCHGPGSEHVRVETASAPQRAPDPNIVNPARLTRERQLDLCSLCHDGTGESLTPALTYQPGDDIARDLRFTRGAAGGSIDVHAGQVRLLRQSRCFQSSSTFSCATCHDVHRAQRDPASFVPVCLSCHAVADCGRFPSLGASLANRCIDCHMPLQTTAKIVSGVEGRTVQPQVRNHRIGIYPELGL